MKCNRYREGMIELGLSVRIYDRSSLFYDLFWQSGLVNEGVAVSTDYEFHEISSDISKGHDTQIMSDKGPRVTANHHTARSFSPGTDQHIVVTLHRAALPSFRHHQKRVISSGNLIINLSLYEWQLKRRNPKPLLHARIVEEG